MLALINLFAALSPSFEGLLVSRVACGVIAARVGPTATVAAAALAPPERRGRSVALVSAGLALAFTIGVPIGSVVGGVFGWRATFVFAGLLLLLAARLIRLFLPPVPGTDRPGLATLAIAGRPAILARLGVTVGAFTVTFSSIAYLGPIVNRATGAEGGAVGAFQACIGLGSVLRILAGGRLANRPRAERALPVLFAMIALTQAGVVAVTLTSTGASALIAASITLGAAALFAILPILQMALIAAAPAQRSVVLALKGSMVFLGQGLGAALGSAAASVWSLTATGIAGGVLAAGLCVGSIMVLAASRRMANLAALRPWTAGTPQDRALARPAMGSPREHEGREPKAGANI